RVLFRSCLARVGARREAMRSRRIGIAWGCVLRAACIAALGVALGSCAGSNGSKWRPMRAAHSLSLQRASGGAASNGAPVYPIVVGVEHAPLTNPERTARVARLLAPLGASSARPHCEQVGWGQMQPAPAAEIDFRELDGFVRGFQSAGFRQLQICLGTHSAWGSRSAAWHLRAESPAPRPEYMEAFGQWIAAVVERYDADGRDDMSGLRGPVRIFEIGSAFSGFNDGFADEYLAMLEQAHRAAHAASAEVLIAPGALLTAGALRGVFDPGRYEAAFATLSERVSLQRLPELHRLLDRPDIFDVFNVRALGDAQETDAVLAWLRWEADRRGYFKPILVTESAPPPLVAWGAATRCSGSPHALGLVLPPAVEADRCRLADFFRSLVDGRDEAVAWAQRYAASELVKKVIVSADHGAWLVSAAPIEDAQWWKQPAFEASAGLSPWGGLLDVRTEERRPAFYALRQLMNALRGRERVRRVRLEQADVRLYTFEGPGGAGWIAWHEPEGLTLPSEPTPRRSIAFGVPGRRVRVEPIITQPGQALPRSRLVATRQGSIELEVTPEPVLVYPET
ncbi:MAG TPA: hypothetical protein VIY27_05985, partial [Myxococcota bacterium]